MKGTQMNTKLQFNPRIFFSLVVIGLIAGWFLG
jgi:hypothetical protein